MHPDGGLRRDRSLRPRRGRGPRLYPVGTAASAAKLCPMGEVAQETSLSKAWTEALRAFDRDLTVRAASEATRRAYSNDVGQLAAWADERGSSPEELGHKDLRRFASHLSDNGISKAGIARKLAAIRSFYSALIRAEMVSANPADLVATPKRDKKLPRVLSRDEMASLLDRIPTRTPLELRDRAMLELAYSCGLRAAEVINLNVDSPDFDSERLRVEGKGAKTRLVPMGEPAQHALTRYLERGRGALHGKYEEKALLVPKNGRSRTPDTLSR